MRQERNTPAGCCQPRPCKSLRGRNEGAGRFKCRQLLNAYVLRRQGEQWKVEASHENIASLGSFGLFGEVTWVSLRSGRPGFTVRHGGTWQGQSISYLSVFGLADRSMHDLTKGVPVFSTSGNCGSDSPSCWSVEGKWQFEQRQGASYDDLVLRFSGYAKSSAEEAPEKSSREGKTLRGMARYKFDGSQYVLIEGENIVPEI
ncbi:hypothetical protein [Pseudoduganella violaceinigra]|uniref:hypothetical protein n=1 Tax=Pseudoduganella violaceinigra TaxID=246602 RepID=UPI00042543CF|nr:hypothetical protein [Pseudoduganella violaceinigra]